MFEIFVQLFRQCAEYLLFLDALWETERTFSEHLQLGTILFVVYGVAFLCLERVTAAVYKITTRLAMATFPRVGLFFTKEIKVAEPAT